MISINFTCFKMMIYGKRSIDLRMRHDIAHIILIVAQGK